MCIAVVLGFVAVSADEPHANLISQQRRHVGQRGHVAECEDRPAPTIRFAFDDRQRRRALCTQGEEDHDRQRHRNIIDRLARVVVAGRAQPRDQSILIDRFVHVQVAPQIVDHS